MIARLGTPILIAARCVFGLRCGGCDEAGVCVAPDMTLESMQMPSSCLQQQRVQQKQVAVSRQAAGSGQRAAGSRKQKQTAAAAAAAEAEISLYMYSNMHIVFYTLT